MNDAMAHGREDRNQSLWREKRPLSKLLLAAGEDARVFPGDLISAESFWIPGPLSPQSGWLEHAPFAFWLIGALRPRTLVELGTFTGFSYFTFCQAVQRLQLTAQCYAVDTWKGDEHAGFYDEETFHNVRKYNEQQFSAFSTLIRSTFDEALPYFIDGSIDLLHIDGRHFYDDVKHDFESWRAKLSDRAIVLFHDINVREHGFGVFRLWDELSRAHLSFAFSHGNGLGVLGVGEAIPQTIRELMAASADTTLNAHIQQAYGRLGAAVTFQLKSELAERQVSELNNELSSRRIDVAALNQMVAESAKEIEALRQGLLESNTNVSSLETMLSEREGQIAELTDNLSARDKHIAELEFALSHAAAPIASVNSFVPALSASTSWRITAPIRGAKRVLLWCKLPTIRHLLQFARRLTGS